jgi:hypothetical protein
MELLHLLKMLAVRHLNLIIYQLWGGTFSHHHFWTMANLARSVKFNITLKIAAQDGLAAQFAVKPIVWHYQLPLVSEIWCYLMEVPLIFMSNLVSLGLSGQMMGEKTISAVTLNFIKICLA